MDQRDKNMISDELLTAYIEGTATPEEMMLVADALKRDESLREALYIIENLDNEASIGRELPMESLAAAAPGNLCDVHCEMRILKDYAFPDSLTQKAGQTSINRWVKDAGTPLHNMGRILELSGMSVTRRYDATLEDIRDNLAKGNRVIAVVNYGLLRNGKADEVYHAVVCLSFLDSLIRVYDPAVGFDTDYRTDEFVKAWDAARNYIVCASVQGMEYEPHPIDLNDVVLDDNLLELSEAIAENAHEVWAQERKNEGWKYGLKRDDTERTTPDMVPYSDLPDSEKEYDRKLAFDTLRLAKKLGFRVEKPTLRKCPHCGRSIDGFAHFCPMCGKELKWTDLQ